MMGFSSFSYDNDSAPAEFYITESGIKEPSDTLMMDELEIKGSTPEKKFPWWILVAGGILGYLNMRG
jgi:hypothetical protein